MRLHTDRDGKIYICDLNVAEAQVIYNALTEYQYAYRRKCMEDDFNDYHMQLIEKMHDEYHDEYCKDVTI